MKTVRFSQVVAKAGSPTVHVSWLPPQKDPVLRKALADHRVMTVHQELRGSRKDFGSVGLLRNGPGQILIFPKSLRRFAEKKVVGIDYDALPKASDKPELSSAAHLEPASAPHARRVGAPAPSPRGSVKPPQARSATRASRPQPEKSRPQSEKTRPKPEKSRPKPASREELLAAIHRAVADLKAGRAVPAYDKLQAVLAENDR